MQSKSRRLLRAPLLACAVLLACGQAQAATASAEPELSTPPGITLVNVTKIYVSSQDQFIWRRIGDQEGKPLYTFKDDPAHGPPACVGECAKEFLPFIADRLAKANSDWTLVDRDGGAKQWAYQGKPLYRYSGADPEGTPFAGDTATAIAEDPEWYNPSSKFHSPKQGWSRAAYTPEKTLILPPGIELESLPIANGFGLVDAASRMTIYMSAPKRKLSNLWIPVPAPALASAIGEFTITNADDGTRQWAYRGQPLFAFRGDYAPGDVEGGFADRNMRVALVYRNFLPDGIKIDILPGRGPLMMTSAGLSVYTQARYNLQYGGRQTRSGYSVPYREAKAVGTRGCVGECLKTWRPVAVPANAQSGGYWEVAARPDGTKQWLYKGTAVYTYIGDRLPGDILGNNRHDIVYGKPDGSNQAEVEVASGGRQGGGNSYIAGSGYYWRTAALYY